MAFQEKGRRSSAIMDKMREIAQDSAVWEDEEILAALKEVAPDKEFSKQELTRLKYSVRKQLKAKAEKEASKSEASA